jgi:hypothetical protein
MILILISVKNIILQKIEHIKNKINKNIIITNKYI